MTGNRLRAKPWLSSQDARASLPRSAAAHLGSSATIGSNGRRAQRDSLPRSERGVWGVWRNTPQNKE